MGTGPATANRVARLPGGRAAEIGDRLLPRSTLAAKKPMTACMGRLHGGRTLTAAEFETLDEREVKGVLRWRLHEAIRAGYAYEDALVLTTHLEVDLWLAIDLPRRGCPHATAMRILL